MLAAYHGHAELVALLLQHGADVNRLNDKGQSPLAGAVFKKEDAVIEVGPASERAPLVPRREGGLALSSVAGAARGRRGPGLRKPECAAVCGDVQPGKLEGEV